MRIEVESGALSGEGSGQTQLVGRIRDLAGELSRASSASSSAGDPQLSGAVDECLATWARSLTMLAGSVEGLGANLGAAVGSVFPVVGTGVGFAVGTAGGAIVGGIVGSGAGTWVVGHTREAVADGAQWVGDETDKAWDSTAGARHAVADGLDKINPF